MLFCFLVRNFAEIGQSVDELWPKKAIFKMAAAAILNFWNFQFLVMWLSWGSISAVVYQVLSKSHDFSPRYGNLAIFKMAAVCHLGFVMTSQYCIAGHIFVVQILSWNSMLIGFVVSVFQRYLQYRMWPFWLYITGHGNFGVAHALYHVTLSLGVQNNHSYEFFDPYLTPNVLWNNSFRKIFKCCWQWRF